MIVAGTGHRPSKLGGYDVKVDLTLKGVAHGALERLNATVVISGMALGWDMAIAEAAILINIPLRAYLPFVGQESIWPKESQKRYNRILAKAQSIVICSKEGYAGWKMSKRNQAMVDDCEALLALWNGDTFGGTYNCVKYALRKKKLIDNVWETYVNAKRF